VLLGRRDFLGGAGGPVRDGEGVAQDDAATGPGEAARMDRRARGSFLIKGAVAVLRCPYSPHRGGRPSKNASTAS
jgi:hypothetical protein